MKPYTYSLLAAVFACGMAQGAATAYTTPVGYITHAINGNAAANPFGADTYIAPTLVLPAVYAGASSATPSGSVISFSGTSVPTTLDSTYMLEITSGTREGWWSSIVSSTNNSITTTDAFPGGLGANVQIAVRKFQTVRSFLGTNGPGFGPTDEVQILDPLSQVVKTAIWVASPGEWQDNVTESSLDNEIIYPGTAVKVRVFGATGINYVSSGEVKVNKTEVDVYPASNWLGATLAGGSTFAGYNFATQLNEEDFNPLTNPPADVIELIYPDQSAPTFIDVGAFMQDVVTEADASAEPILQGTGYGLLRDATAPASVLVVPAQVVAP